MKGGMQQALGEAQHVALMQKRVNESLDKAYANGYHIWLAMSPPEEIAEDMIEKDQTFEYETVERLIPFIKNWSPKT